MNAISIRDVAHLSAQQLTEYLHGAKTMDVFADFAYIEPELYSLEIVQHIATTAKQIGVDFTLYIAGNNVFNDDVEQIFMLFNNETLQLFEQIDKFLTENDLGKIMFYESDGEESSWTWKQVKRANVQINRAIRFVKDNKLTPLEAMLFVHILITSNFQYKDDSLKPRSSRSIVGAFNTDLIVCAGYSYLAKAIVDKLNMPGLRCGLICETDVYEDGRKIGHMKNLVTIADSAYNVFGVYANDCCFDAKDEKFVDGKGFANFMIPVNDLLCYTGYTIAPDETDVLLGECDADTLPQDLPFIKNNKDNSAPIPLDVLKNCICKTYSILYPQETEQQIALYVDSAVNLSAFCGNVMFDENATNAFAQLARNKA